MSTTTDLLKWMNTFMQPREDIGPMHEVRVDFDDGTHLFELRDEHGHVRAFYGDQTRAAMASAHEKHEQAPQTEFERDYPVRNVLKEPAAIAPPKDS